MRDFNPAAPAFAANRFRANCERVFRLFAVARVCDHMPPTQPGPPPCPEACDVLRAAIVLLHAAFEDFLRSLAKQLVPDATPDVLSAIPVLNCDSQKIWA